MARLFVKTLVASTGVSILVVALLLRLSHYNEHKPPNAIKGSSYAILGPVRFLDPPPWQDPTYSQLEVSDDTDSLGVVLASTTKDDVSWIETIRPNKKAFVYVADSSNATLTVPTNRGHEAMIYLTYIIDHYFELPAVVMFMHAHRWAWHNPATVSFDAAELVQRLDLDHVKRVKYMNLKCELNPGCPDWLHLYEEGDMMEHQEQRIVAASWKELFPFDEMPQELAQPCCGQFAVARDRLQAIPLSRYVYYRDWLMRTELTDFFSGRVFEFMWQYIFTGKGVVCPDERDCLCSGFAICFNEDDLDSYKALVRQHSEAEREFTSLRTNSQSLKSASLLSSSNTQDLGREQYLLAKIEAMEYEMRNLREKAKEGKKIG